MRNGKVSVELLARALERARANGCVNLIKFYTQQIDTLTAGVPKLPHRDKPKVTLVVDHKGWCGERLSLNLINEIKDEYECEVVRLGDREHLTFDSDLYIYRNISWLNTLQLPEPVLNRTILLCEGERPLTMDYAKRYGDVLGVIPLNQRLVDKLKKFNPKHLWTPIGNGIDTKSFTATYEYPHEFTVGAAGNFSVGYYDDWKGFSKYIVPACKRARVKLEWRGWQGKSQTPGLKSKQEKLSDMPSFYKQISCLVSMSKSEGCSGVVFEAMASGVPVISTKVGWHGEQEGTGIIWVERPENETPENVELAIQQLAANIDNVRSMRLSTLGKQGREFAQKYSWPVLAKEWKRALKFYIALSKQNEGTQNTSI